MSRKISYKVPMYIKLGVKKIKNYSLNLNTYRNLHYQINNKLKQKFKEYLPNNLPKMNQIEIEYIIYPPNKRLLDLSNVGSVVDKYNCDALIELGVIEDDNYTYVKRISYSFGSIDKDKKGYVLITIKEIK